MTEGSSFSFRAVIPCSACQLPQFLPPLKNGEVARCGRCGSSLHTSGPMRLHLAGALAFAALIFYVPANLLPIVLAENQGRQIEITIIQGIRNLFEQGHFSVGVLVLATSFLTPMLKILGLLFLTLAPKGGWQLRRRRGMYDLIHVLNPWNTMEIFLLAVLLTLVDFGAVASLQAGNGAPAFVAVVVLTTASSMVLVPSCLWNMATRDQALPGRDR